MPRFLDVHSMKGLDEGPLKEIQHAPTDEFGHAISQTTAIASFVFAFSRHTSVFVVVCR